MYKLKISRGARKDLAKAKHSGHKGLLKKLEEILMQPKLKGKLLHGDLSGFRSSRAAPFRIIYLVDDENRIVELIKIENRDDVYEDI